jgi:hypothetical protein
MFGSTFSKFSGNLPNFSGKLSELSKRVSLPGDFSNKAQGAFDKVTNFAKDKNPFKSKPTTSQMEKRIGSLTDFYNKALPINHYDKTNYGTILDRDYYLKNTNGEKLYIGKHKKVELKKKSNGDDFYLVHFETSDGKQTTLTEEDISNGSIYYEVTVPYDETLPLGGRGRGIGTRRGTTRRRGRTSKKARTSKKRNGKKQTYRRRNINSK